jgi:hypothetical protein
MVQPHGRTLIDQPRQNRVRCPNKSRISREIARTSRVRRRSCATSMPERTERDARTRRSNRHIGPRSLAPEDSHGLICLRHHAPRGLDSPHPRADQKRSPARQPTGPRDGALACVVAFSRCGRPAAESSRGGRESASVSPPRTAYESQGGQDPAKARFRALHVTQ